MNVKGFEKHVYTKQKWYTVKQYDYAMTIKWFDTKSILDLLKRFCKNSINRFKILLYRQKLSPIHLYI